MTWIQPPGPRGDMCFEGLIHTDVSTGNFSTDYLDSGGVFSIRLAARFLNVAGSGLAVSEYIYDGAGTGSGNTPRLVRSQPVTLTDSNFNAYAELKITARWFTVSGGGDADDYVALTVRRIS